MSMPRRRLIRAPVTNDPQRQVRQTKLRAKLEREKAVLARWMQRLKRSFHAIEKSQQRINRWERQLAPSEG